MQLRDAGFAVNVCRGSIISFSKDNAIAVNTTHGWVICLKDTKKRVGSVVGMIKAKEAMEELL